jgi:hypothetical protein
MDPSQSIGSIAVITNCSLRPSALCALRSAIFFLLISTAPVWMANTVAHAQSTDVQRTFDAPRTEVEKQLRENHANTGGKLPTLEGFAASGDHPLDRYRRGYYQYEVQVRSISATKT